MSHNALQLVRKDIPIRDGAGYRVAHPYRLRLEMLSRGLYGVLARACVSPPPDYYVGIPSVKSPEVDTLLFSLSSSGN